MCFPGVYTDSLSRVVTSLSSGSRTSGCNKTPSLFSRRLYALTGDFISSYLHTLPDLFSQPTIFTRPPPLAISRCFSRFLSPRTPRPDSSRLEILSRPSFFLVSLLVSFYPDHHEARATCSCQSQSRAECCRVHVARYRSATATFKSS